MIAKNSKHRKKIIFIANVLTHHQVFNSLLIHKMANRGWDVRIVSFLDTKLKIKTNSRIKFINWDVSRTSVNPVTELKSLNRLCRIVRRENPDVIHNFTIKANIYGTVAGRLYSRAKIVNTINGLGYVYLEKSLSSSFKRTIIKFVWRWTLKFSHVVLFMNKDDKKTFSNYFILPETDIIPGHGIDLNLFRKGNTNPSKIEKIKLELRLKKNQLLVVTIGRLIRQKGILEFWQAANRLGEEIPNAVFLVVGMTDNYNPTRITPDEIRRMESERFIFLNDRSDVKEILSLADIFLLASYREGGPQVIIEAMAMGLPIITTNVAGCRERVEVNRNGLLVPSQNSDALYKAMKKLLTSKNLRRNMGLESLKIAKKKYDCEILTEKIIKYYMP